MSRKINCNCNKILGFPEDRVLILHLSGCPDSKEMKEYNKLPWYKKLFKLSPTGSYKILDY